MILITTLQVGEKDLTGFRPFSIGLLVAERDGMDSDDARYERPCRWLLAVAAGIHWVATAAALPLSPQLDVQPAVQLATTIERLLSVLLQA